MAKVGFFRCDRSTFDTLKTNGNLVDGAIYFITDEGCLEQAYDTGTSIGSKVYGKHVQLLPDNYSFETNPGRSGVLYICDGQGKLYDSTDGWQTVFDATVVDVVQDGNSYAVSSNAVYDYLTTNYPKSAAGGQGEGGKIPVLDANGQIPANMIPSLALSEYIGNVTSSSNLTTLSTAQKGDWATVYDSSNPDASDRGSYILAGTGVYSVASNWVLMADHVEAITVDASFVTGSTNPVSSSAIQTALAGKISNPTSSAVTSGSEKYLKATNTSGTITLSWVDPLSWTDLP